MQYYYESGYSDWESCPINTIAHTSEFSQEEFNQILLDCYVKADKLLSIKHLDWIEEFKKEEKVKGENIDDIDEMYPYKTRVSDMYEYVRDMLIKEYGFFEPKITASFVPDDTANIKTVKNKSSHSNCEFVKLLRDRFNITEIRNQKIDSINK